MADSNGLIEQLGGARHLPVAALAWLGDAYWEFYVRDRLLRTVAASAHRLSYRATGYVSAVAQAAALRVIEDTLTPEEQAVARRGRNHRPSSLPRNVNPVDYAQATALEVLLGYLHVDGRQERLAELSDLLFRICEQQIEDKDI